MTEMRNYGKIVLRAKILPLKLGISAAIESKTKGCMEDARQKGGSAGGKNRRTRRKRVARQEDKTERQRQENEARR